MSLLGRLHVKESELKTENKIGLIGAYERDNFGDLLFLERAHRYLGESAVVPLAPFSRSETASVKHTADVERYSDAIGRRRLKGVFVVGGEVGGTSVADAFRMSSSASDYDRWLGERAVRRRQLLELHLGASAFSSPYLPRMSASERTLTIPLVVNSVGLSGIRRLMGSRRDEAWNAVRESSHLSVRDRDSSNVLKSGGVAHILAPDVVHTLRLDKNFVPEVRPDVALVQVKSGSLQRIGPQRFAEALSASASLKGMKIQLFAAGYASGHDSLELYRSVSNAFCKIDSSKRLLMPEDLNPLEKAKMIAGCGVWIGTSLHGWIISSSFCRPRVGLDLVKVGRYARTWSDPMPTEVGVDDMDSAIARAFEVDRRFGEREEARMVDMAQVAEHSMRGACAALESELEESEVAARLSTSKRLSARQAQLSRSALDAALFWKGR